MVLLIRCDFTNDSDIDSMVLLDVTQEEPGEARSKILDVSDQMDLFYHHSIVIDDRELLSYSKNWHKPALAKDLARYDSLEDLTEEKEAEIKDFFQPRGVQIEVLYALENSRAEGAGKKAAGNGRWSIIGEGTQEKLSRNTILIFFGTSSAKNQYSC